MQAVLIVVQLIVSIALVIVVLLQKSEGGALGIGGGGGGGLFSARGAADTLTRTTAILAVLFFLTSMGLTLLALHTKPKASILDSGTSTPITAPLVPKKAPTPAAPEVPTVPSPQQ